MIVRHPEITKSLTTSINKSLQKGRTDPKIIATLFANDTQQKNISKKLAKVLDNQCLPSIIILNGLYTKGQYSTSHHMLLPKLVPAEDQLAANKPIGAWSVVVVVVDFGPWIANLSLLRTSLQQTNPSEPGV